MIIEEHISEFGECFEEFEVSTPSSTSLIDINKETSTSEAFCYSDEHVNENIQNVSEDKDQYDVGQASDDGLSYDPSDENSWKKLEFSSYESCRSFYDKYAVKVGFETKVRFSNKCKVTGLKRYFALSCNEQGYKVGSLSDPKNVNMQPDDVLPDTTSNPKPETRVNCEAHMYFKMKKDRHVYIIERWTDDHCHPLQPSSHSHLLKMNRRITQSESSFASCLERAGISLRSSYDIMGMCAGGKDALGFLKMDLKNHLNRMRQKTMEHGEGTFLMEYFRAQQFRSPMFYYNVVVDNQEQIANVFWADDRMRMDYYHFGDVVCFDTTFNTNRASRPLAVFVGLNHHRKTCIFGASLLYDETMESFVWLFKTFLTCMNDKSPVTILTDQDAAMAGAIKIVFPSIFHGLCTWHLIQNGMKNLGPVVYKALKDDIKRLMYHVSSEDDFEQIWISMVKCHFPNKEPHGHSWLQRIYEKRQQWSSAWTRLHFSGGMRSTQLSESFNSSLKSYLKPGYKLDKFFAHFNELINTKRRDELKCQYDNIRYAPLNDFLYSPIVCQAAEVYTRNMFKTFQQQFAKSLCYVLRPMEGACSASHMRFEVQFDVNGVKKDKWEVFVDVECIVLECSCHLFDSLGVLCCHLLSVMHFLGISGSTILRRIPERYILQRWTKNAKSVNDYLLPNTAVDVSIPLEDRVSFACMQFYKIASSVCDYNDTFQILQEDLNILSIKFCDLLKDRCVAEATSSVASVNAIPGETHTFKVKDNAIKSKSRLRSGIEVNLNKSDKKRRGKGKDSAQKEKSFIKFI